MAPVPIPMVPKRAISLKSRCMRDIRTGRLSARKLSGDPLTKLGIDKRPKAREWADSRFRFCFAQLSRQLHAFCAWTTRLNTRLKKRGVAPHSYLRGDAPPSSVDSYRNTRARDAGSLARTMAEGEVPCGPRVVVARRHRPSKRTSTAPFNDILSQQSRSTSFPPDTNEKPYCSVMLTNSAAP